MLDAATVRRSHTARSLRLFAETYLLGVDGEPLRYSRGQRYAIEAVQAIADGAPGDPLRVALMLPRGHGKTTTILTAAVLWLQFRLDHPSAPWGSRYALLVTAGTLYKQLSRDLRLILTGLGPLTRNEQGEPLLLLDWGITPSKDHRRADDVALWQIDDFAYYVRGSLMKHRRRVSVRGINAGEMNVRGLVDVGHRPDLGWIDDPMKDLEADNVEITERVKLTIRSAFAAAFAPGARFAATGTPFNDRDLITSIVRSPEEWPDWIRVRLPCYDPRGRPLLPNVWDDEALTERRRAIGSRAFASQYLLDPHGGDVRLFDEAWINRWMLDAPPRSPGCVRVMYCDPSLGRTTRSDLSAIVVLDRHTDGVTWVRYCSMERRRPAKLVCDYLDLWVEWDPDAHSIEDEGQQSLLIPLFGRARVDRRLPQAAVPGVQSVGGISKVTRIRSLSAEVEFGRLRFDAGGSHRALRDQAAGYQGRPNERADGLDALEGALRLANSQLTGDWDITDNGPAPEFSGVLTMDF